MQGKRLIRIFVFIAIMAALLCGCGKSEIDTENTEATENNDVISDNYAAEAISLEAGVKSPLLSGSRIYYVLENEESGYTICQMDIDDKEVVKKALSFGDHTFNLLNFTVDTEGNLYYIVTIKPEDNTVSQWSLHLIKNNAEGEEVYFRKITEDIGYSFVHMQADEQGRLSFRYDKTYHFDENGLYLGEDEYKTDSEKAIEFYNQKMSLGKFGIDSSQVQEISFLEDGRIEVLTKNADAYDLWLLTPSEVSVNENKTELVLGVLQSNSSVRSLVADFNKNRQDIYVTVREYQPLGSSRTTEEAIAVLTGDFLAGNGPDLIALNHGENHAALAAQGILEDLAPYVEQSAVIRRGNFPDAVWELGRQGSLQYAIPVRFSLQTLAGKAAFLGEQDKWTVAELAELSREHPESLLVDPSSKSAVFSMCCIFQAEAFMDKEAGECHFDAPDFYEILEFADTFASDGEADSVPDSLKYQEDRVLLMEADLYNADSYLAVCQAFGMAPLNFIGYPARDGLSGHMLSPCNEMYGISSRSAYKQEAWDFVEYYAQWDGENAGSVGFPADSRRLEQWLTEQTDSGKLEQESAENLEELIVRIAGEAVSKTLWGEEANILQEEVSLYFQGQKSLDETIRILENRIGLYLKESR